MINLDDGVPKDQFLRIIEKYFNWNLLQTIFDKVIELLIVYDFLDLTAVYIGYNTSVICDNNNYILTVDTNPSNMHDSVAFYESYENFIKHYGITNTKYFVGDAAYLTTHIGKTLIENMMISALPHSRLGSSRINLTLCMLWISKNLLCIIVS